MQKLTEQSLGDFESRVVINHNEIDYHIPIIVRVSEGAITINEDGGKLGIDISSPFFVVIRKDFRHKSGNWRNVYGFYCSR